MSADAHEALERLENARGWDEADLNDFALVAAELTRMEEALREAKLHQGLPEDAPPARVAQHFRGNRELAEGFRALAPSPAATKEP